MLLRNIQSLIKGLCVFRGVPISILQYRRKLKMRKSAESKRRIMAEFQPISCEPEVRDGFRVERKAKELWNVQLELANQLRGVCERHNIKYFSIGGTCLGAVRHKGYIPWDDDMDFALMDSDFREFTKWAEKEIKYPYYFQNMYDQNGLRMSFSRIRKSTTTYISEYEYSNYSSKDNHGIYIDIFPVYATADSKMMRKLHMLRIKAFSPLRMGYVACRKEYNKDKAVTGKAKGKWPALWRIYCKLGGSNKKLSDGYHHALSHYMGKDTGTVGLISFKTNDERLIWKRAWFDEVKWMEFENTTVPVPAGYDQMLTHQFGDWHTPVMGAQRHDTIFYDVNVGYEEYFKKLHGETK